jgi:hypothetical protein
VRLTATFALILGLVGSFTAVPASASPAFIQCGGGRGWTGCDKGNRVTIAGTASGEPRERNAHAPDANSVRYVACGSAVPGDLNVADSTFAAADCRLAPPACASAAAHDGAPRTAELILRRQPDGSWRYGGWTCVVTGPPQVTAAMVRERVSRLIPAAAIGLAPEQTTLVNIETVMWVDAPRQRTLPAITILGRSVRITIRLAQVSWNFGDGERDTSPTAGKAYDGRTDPCDARLCPSYYGHLYVHTGMMQISATATWTATFTVGTGRPVTIPGTVTGPTATAPIHVKQARGVLVPNPGEH